MHERAEPYGWKRPASHALHLVVPGEPWYCPAEHGAHIALPVVAVILPPVQDLQYALSLPYVSWNCPAKHLLQGYEPELDLRWPYEHPSHPRSHPSS